MFKFIARRILETIPVLFIIITGCFFMIRLAPGGPFDSERRTSPEIQHNLEAYYGLDKPLYEQYFIYLGKLVLHGDLGPSFRYPSRTVNEIIADSLPVSFELGCYGIAIALLIGVSAGIIASLRPNTVTDYVPMTLAMIGVCLPTFVLGPLLVLAFAMYTAVSLSMVTQILLIVVPALLLAFAAWRRWKRPVPTGAGLLVGGLLGWLLVLFITTDHQWFYPSGWNFAPDRVLPSLTLGIFYAAYLARLTRGGMLEILGQDFIRTARAKGASETRVVLRHALRGGMLPVVSFLGPALAGIISGSFIVEKIFQIPGLGQQFVTSASNRDYTMILGTVIFFAVLIIFFNLVVDVVQVFLNPRLRFS